MIDKEKTARIKKTELLPLIGLLGACSRAHIILGRHMENIYVFHWS